MVPPCTRIISEGEAVDGVRHRQQLPVHSPPVAQSSATLQVYMILAGSIQVSSFSKPVRR